VLAVASITAADGQGPTPRGSNTADLTIKTREGGDSTSATQITHTLYSKGAWQRRETHYRFADGSAQANTAFIAITRCDDQTTTLLNPAVRVFGRSKIMPHGSVSVTAMADKGFRSRKRSG
jgi:hypothetical protein